MMKFTITLNNLSNSQMRALKIQNRNQSTATNPDLSILLPYLENFEEWHRS